MKTTVKIFGIIALAALGVFFTACYENFGIDTRPEPVVPEFIPVEEIKGIPAGVLPYREIVLSGKVMPENATNKRIVWSIKEDGGTGAALERNRLYSETEEGTVTLTATIKNGSGENVDYTQDFNIRISTSFAPVSSITGIPQIIDVGEYVLEGIVRPTNAANKEIDWTVRDAGTTGAVIHGNILTTTAAGTAVITATVPYGKLTEDYTQDFAIVVFTEVASIGDIPSVVQVGNYTLEGVVAPSNATNQTITWSVTDAGATGATINGNVLNTTGLGTVTVRAAIANGLLDGDYTQDFTITISATLVAVSGITGIPSTLESGSHALNGVVTPSEASNKNITWSVTSPGTTGATINGNILKTTATGTVTVRATIPNGLLNGNNYTQDFNITITKAKSVYVAGTGSYQVGGSSNAYYWKDGELYALHNSIWNSSNTAGIVAANGKLYIAGNYNSSTACYWVVEDEEAEAVTLTATNSSNSETKFIAVDGSTVYITGTDGSQHCYWKIEANGTVTKVNLQLPVSPPSNGTFDWNGRFAVQNGNLYIPFQYLNGNNIIRSYYWDKDGNNQSIPLNIQVYSTAVVNNGTVYMAGRVRDNNLFKPFYWVMGEDNYIILDNQGCVYWIIEHNGSLRFYGNQTTAGMGTIYIYWDAVGNNTNTNIYGDESTLVFSDGNNVYLSYGAGYFLEVEQDSHSLFNPEADEDSWMILSGFAVH